jgi:hypothetical protein
MGKLYYLLLILGFLTFAGCGTLDYAVLDNSTTFSVNCLNCNGSSTSTGNISIKFPNPLNVTVKNTALKVYGTVNTTGTSSITFPNPINTTVKNWPTVLNTSEYDRARTWSADYTGNNQRLLTIDTNLSDVKGFVVYINGTFGGTLTFYTSYNKKNNYTLGCWPLSGGALVTTATAGNAFWCPANVRYIMFGTTAWTSGKLQVQVYSSSELTPYVQNTQTVSGSVTATVSTTTNIPATGQGSSTYHNQLINSTKYLNSVKTSVGVIGSFCVSNSNQTSGYYLKMYNKASAPAPASDTPIFVYYIPANFNDCLDMGAWGVRYTTGIAYSVVKNVIKTDSTAPNNNLVSVNIAYT